MPLGMLLAGAAPPSGPLLPAIGGTVASYVWRLIRLPPVTGLLAFGLPVLLLSRPVVEAARLPAPVF